MLQASLCDTSLIISQAAALIIRRGAVRVDRFRDVVAHLLAGRGETRIQAALFLPKGSAKDDVQAIGLWEARLTSGSGKDSDFEPMPKNEDSKLGHARVLSARFKKRGNRDLGTDFCGEGRYRHVLTLGVRARPYRGECGLPREGTFPKVRSTHGILPGEAQQGPHSVCPRRCALSSVQC